LVVKKNTQISPKKFKKENQKWGPYITKRALIQQTAQPGNLPARHKNVCARITNET
jgi:hypothetical protein